jgi:oligopeptide transport system substrate-binding protein
MRFRKTFGWLTLCTILVTNFSACGPSDSSSAVAPGDKDLRILRRGNGGEPQSLDPALAEDVHAFNILVDLYEGLVVESVNGSLRPGVAYRWDISPDGLKYTFHLRDEAVWSNGDPVTADEFVTAFHRAVSPDSVSPYSFLLGSIRNYQAVLNADLPVRDLGVRAIDKRTLVIELQSPTQYFPGILAMPIAYPVHKTQNDGPAQYGDPKNFLGNGPFVLDGWTIGSVIRLRKNARFRNALAVGIDVVDYFPISEPAMEFNMFRAGELDITATVPPAAMSSLREILNGELRIAPSLGLYYLAFDMTEPPFDDVVLRQALTMAIDRDVLVSVLGRGEQGAFGIVPPGVSNYKGAQFEWKNMSLSVRHASARDFYARAGYGDSNPLQMKLTYDAGDVHETVALAVASMWRDILGVSVELEKKEWKFFLATRDDRAAWQVMRFAWSGDYNDASTFTEIFRSDSKQNLARYRSDTYDELLNEADGLTDSDLRAAKLSAAEAVLLADYPISPLYFYVSKHLVSKRVKNFQDNVLDRHPSQFLQLDVEKQQ